MVQAFCSPNWTDLPVYSFFFSNPSLTVLLVIFLKLNMIMFCFLYRSFCYTPPTPYQFSLGYNNMEQFHGSYYLSVMYQPLWLWPFHEHSSFFSSFSLFAFMLHVTLNAHSPWFLSWSFLTSHSIVQMSFSLCHLNTLGLLLLSSHGTFGTLAIVCATLYSNTFWTVLFLKCEL